MMKKEILYIDMDGVVADFDAGVKALCPGLETGDNYGDYQGRHNRVNEVCEANPDIFHNLPPIEGAIESVNELFDLNLFEIYFLSVPMWNVPDSFTGKRIWLEKHFGKRAEFRLILTHRKDLNVGHYLVDDRLRHGVSEFTGKHIHFGSIMFPDWMATKQYLLNKRYEKNNATTNQDIKNPE